MILKLQRNSEKNIIGETMFKLLKNYQTRNLQILDIEINRGKLEQFFMKLTEGE